ncbi:MAG: nucleoside hydrolase [Patescibacteria group bacterium]
MQNKIHLDTDIGGDIDDLCALAMILKWKQLEITGITTTAEDNGKRAGYAKYILKIAGREEIPVAAGTDVSSGYYRYKPGYPPENLYWPEPISPLIGPVDNAIELLKNSIEQGAVIVGIGPFTNFVLLDKKYPGLLNRAKLFLMGGFIYPPRDGFPRWGNNMDYNVQLDISSAKYIFENFNPTLIPLAVTIETALRKSYLSQLEKSGPVGKLIAKQAQIFARDYDNENKYGKTCSGLPKDIINFQHDPLACAVALGWDGVKIERLPLRMELKDGWLYETISESGKIVSVVTEVERERFNKIWLDIVTA